MCSGWSKAASELAIVALGSNLGDSVQIIEAAIERLAEVSEGAILRASLWKSTPVDCPPGSPEFVNTVVALKPLRGETAEHFLEFLQALEKEFGRRPKQVLNESRPLDLDLINFRSEILNTPRLILPHPRAHLRRFVLQPLAEILPEEKLPGQEKKNSELLKDLNSPEVVTRLERRAP